MQKVILKIDGMSCSACSNGLEKYLNKQEKIKNASVNLVMATASIEYEDDLSLKEIEQFIQIAGFESLGVTVLDEKKKKVSITPFIIYGILAFLLMYISMAHMFPAIEILFLNKMKYPKIYSISLLILTIPFLFYGSDILKSGFLNFIHKMPNMDTLVGIGVLSSFCYSLFGVIMVFLGHTEYTNQLYFESTAFVIYFMKLGRFIDSGSKEKTKEAIKELVTITPKTVKRKLENGIEEITIDEVQKGDILVCYAGDKIGVDGVITKGITHLDESFITGESKPATKQIGNTVIAGSINYDGYIEYEAVKIGKESTISEIVKLVIEATNTKAPIALLADKISNYFVPFIIVIATLTFLGCQLLGFPFSESINRFVTVLVVACPCALGLATPLAIVVSEGTCAKNGILVKMSETLELVSHIDMIVFDKTGTLTNGNLTISNMYNYSEYKDEELLSILGGIEQKSTHPIAKGIMRYIEEKNISFIDNFEVENLAGYGIKAVQDKDTYYACNKAMLEKLSISSKVEESDLSKDGNSIVYLVKNDKVLALLGVKDTVRENAKDLISNLKKQRKEVIMLTGDNQETASKIANELNIDRVISNVVPKEKAKVISDLKAEGKKVMMVGDGINDAPSLTLADIGVSVSGGTDIATDSSDVILMNNNLYRISDLLIIGKRTLNNIKENLFWAFLYNVCMIPLAMGVFSKYGIMINPMIACIAMIISSLTVIINALRLKRIRLSK